MKERNRRKFHILLPICMAAIVIILDVLFVLLPDREMSESENRVLQQFPSISWNTLTDGSFESNFDDYVADQFPGRDGWIAAETTLQRLGGNTMSHDILLGQDGYLIQRFEMPNEDSYEKILSAMTEIANAHRDLSVYALIAPTAASVMKDKLPVFAANEFVAGDEDVFISRLLEDLGQSGIVPVDVRLALNNLKVSGMQVYYRTDHHWTTDAAYEAYKVFASAAGISETGYVAGIQEAAFQDDQTEFAADADQEAGAVRDTTVSGIGTAYDRLMVTDSFKGTLSASSGFRSNISDCIYIYLPEEENEDYRYTMVNVDTGQKSMSLYDSSYLQSRDKYGMFLGGNHAELTIRTSFASERNILVLKDSYANCFIPFLIPNFGNIIVVDPRYYAGDLDQLIRDENITDILFLYNAGTL